MQVPGMPALPPIVVMDLLPVGSGEFEIPFLDSVSCSSQGVIQQRSYGSIIKDTPHSKCRLVLFKDIENETSAYVADVERKCGTQRRLVCGSVRFPCSF